MCQLDLLVPLIQTTDFSFVEQQYLQSRDFVVKLHYLIFLLFFLKNNCDSRTKCSRFASFPFIHFCFFLLHNLFSFFLLFQLLLLCYFILLLFIIMLNLALRELQHTHNQLNLFTFLLLLMVLHFQILRAEKEAKKNERKKERK